MIQAVEPIISRIICDEEGRILAFTENPKPVEIVDDKEAIDMMSQLGDRLDQQMEEFPELMAALVIKYALPEIVISPKLTEEQIESPDDT